MHTLLDGVFIVTEGVSEVQTVIVMLLEVAVVGLAHVAFEVNTHVTTSPLASDELV